MPWVSRRHARARATWLALAACASFVVIAEALGAGSRAAAQGLPDLIVSDLTLRTDCVVLVTLKNQGPGPLPSLAPDALKVRPFKNGSAYGAESPEPAAVDALRPAGGTVTVPVGILVDGEADVSVTVDNSGAVAEASETNNTFTKRLSCSASLPDIAITGIRFSPPSCAPILTLTNRGNGPLPERAYSEIYLKRIFDGVHVADVYGPHITDLDPKRSLQPAGGTLEWTDPRPFRAVKTVRYELTGVLFIQKYSAADDKVETTVPATCLPDLVIDGMTTNAACDILVSLRNAGPGPLPSKPAGADEHAEVALPSLQFWITKGNVTQAYGGTQLSSTEAAALRLPGGTVTFTRRQSNPDAPVPVQGIVKVEIESFDRYREARTDNNTLETTLSCGGPAPLTPAPRPNETAEVLRRPVPLSGSKTPRPLPPLAIRGVTWTAACRAVLTVANASGAPLMDALYRKDGARLERSMTGTARTSTTLAAIDPTGVLKRAGGTLEWTDPTIFVSSGMVRWEIRGLGDESGPGLAAAESVPARCNKRVIPKR
jgi:hypothetical protein